MRAHHLADPLPNRLSNQPIFGHCFSLPRLSAAVGAQRRKGAGSMRKARPLVFGVKFPNQARVNFLKSVKFVKLVASPLSPA